MKEYVACRRSFCVYCNGSHMKSEVERRKVRASCAQHVTNVLCDMLRVIIAISRIWGATSIADDFGAISYWSHWHANKAFSAAAELPWKQQQRQHEHLLKNSEQYSS
ncbi:hypothetical protein ENH_00066070 [Eimeria necatrix]|uniref:Uncharacterized protein n=1 Tax=Eimeria necatrix TaxID=51315 RepID=U6N1T2_9EIME|nr:hypothetical protein ENH_00066070 [Eimeria necatrix]CDJ69263.1 hypothetical protein ENH_00066070 [Eimeria necatrix]